MVVGDDMSLAVIDKARPLPSRSEAFKTLWQFVGIEPLWQIIEEIPEFFRNVLWVFRKVLLRFCNGQRIVEPPRREKREEIKEKKLCVLGLFAVKIHVTNP